MIQVVLLSVFIVTCSAPHIFAGAGMGEVDFSADMVMKSEGQQMQSTLFVSGQKSRMQSQMGTMIVRSDKNVSWMIMQNEQMYMENPINPKQTPKTSREMPGETERVLIGEESINGKMAKKFKVTYVENGNQTSAYQWIADEFPIPVKMEALDGSWMVEYQNIKLGKQPDILFEVPQGYQKFAIPNMGDLLQGFAGRQAGE